MGVGRAARRERAGRVADADPRAQDRGRRAPGKPRPLEPAHLRLDRRAVEPGALPLAVGGGGRGPACRSSTSPAAPRSGPASSRPIRSRRSRSARSAAPRTAWTSTCSTPTGNPVRGQVGELVCKQPWPGMTRGIWGDPERYIETYWSMYPDVWRHGDWALIDEEGDWFLLGRSDDTINVAGKRLGPAEVESVLVSHPAVAESAVVGVPRRDQGRGDLVLLRARRTAPATDVAEELRELVATRAGPAVQAVAGRVRRRAAEDALGQDPAPRGARGRDRRGPGRHVVGREPAGARADPRRAG